jgi:hypothetical protein
MRARLMLGLALVLALGCGSRKIAPVSGRVTLNGKPVANALVAFNPIPQEGTSEAGPGSVGTTNDQGEFTLIVSSNRKGALVGKHRVAISAMNPQAGESDARVPRGRRPLVNTIPSRYNEKSELTFEVPPGGTDQANFPLESP